MQNPLAHRTRTKARDERNLDHMLSRQIGNAQACEKTPRHRFCVIHPRPADSDASSIVGLKQIAKWGEPWPKTTTFRRRSSAVFHVMIDRGSQPETARCGLLASRAKAPLQHAASHAAKRPQLDTAATSTICLRAISLRARGANVNPSTRGNTNPNFHASSTRFAMERRCRSPTGSTLPSPLSPASSFAG